MACNDFQPLHQHTVLPSVIAIAFICRTGHRKRTTAELLCTGEKLSPSQSSVFDPVTFLPKRNSVFLSIKDQA